MSYREKQETETVFYILSFLGEIKPKVKRTRFVGTVLKALLKRHKSHGVLIQESDSLDFI